MPTAGKQRRCSLATGSLGVILHTGSWFRDRSPPWTPCIFPVALKGPAINTVPRSQLAVSLVGCWTSTVLCSTSMAGSAAKLRTLLNPIPKCAAFEQVIQLLSELGAGTALRREWSSFSRCSTVLLAGAETGEIVGQALSGLAVWSIRLRPRAHRWNRSSETVWAGDRHVRIAASNVGRRFLVVIRQNLLTFHCSRKRIPL